MVAQVLQNVSLNLAHIEHDDFGVICNVTFLERKSLGLGVVSKHVLRHSSTLSQSVAKGAIAVLDIDRLNLIASRANCLIRSSSGIAGNSDIVSPLDGGLLVLKLAADLHFEQTARNQTIGTADGDSLILLQRVQLATLLTGDVGLFLSLSDSCILQLVQSEPECTSHDVKCIDSLKAGDGDIIDIHLDIPPICELANSNHLGLGLSR